MLPPCGPAGTAPRSRLPQVCQRFLALDSPTAELVTAAVDLLAAEGPLLERPVVDRVKGSSRHNMKELRPGSAGRTEVRISFVFDPERTAVLLVAGDKAGRWKDWYRINIPSRRHATTSGSAASGQRRPDVARNWTDVRADAVSGGRVDETRVTHERRKLTARFRLSVWPTSARLMP